MMNLIFFLVGGLTGFVLVATLFAMAEGKHPVYTEDDYGDYEDPENARKN